jgi:hypothetical protein
MSALFLMLTKDCIWSILRVQHFVEYIIAVKEN